MAKNKKKSKINGARTGIRPRHITAMKNLGKSRTEAQALEKLNYSKSYAESGQIKKTKSWKAVAEEMLPNELLAEVNLGLLKHKSWQARSSGLDKAYKAKKIYTNGIEIKDNRKYGDLNKEQLAEEVARRAVGLLGGGRREDSGTGE